MHGTRYNDIRAELMLTLEPHFSCALLIGFQGFLGMHLCAQQVKEHDQIAVLFPGITNFEVELWMKLCSHCSL